MPPKRGRGRGRGRGGKSETPIRSTRSGARRRKNSESEDGGNASESNDEFDKSTLMSIKRYNFDKILTDPAFEHDELITRIAPEEFNMDYYKKSGLSQPLHFRCPSEKLGMSMPNDDITVDDIKNMVGAHRMIEVVEVMNQGSKKMDLGQFVEYYNTPKNEKSELYNVLSLEFSLSPLADLVKSPKLVRDVDWVENHWPDELRQRYLVFNKKGQYQPHHTYPKVQYYCLMSPSDCYTDFHIDFGGTSVWYHVKKGRKIFWLVEPSESNLTMYEEFVKNPTQSGFFGDVVETCARVELIQGDTMIIPAGWIHAVYTPADSLVFGGNFLHSLRAAIQIRCFQSENKIQISKKFRFPYLEELVFYVIADYVKASTGREYYRTGDVSDARYDHVGKAWLEAKGHHKKIVASDYQFDVDPQEGEQEQEEGTKTVIAMHAESSATTNELMRHPDERANTSGESRVVNDMGLEDSGDENEERECEETERLTTEPKHEGSSRIYYDEKSPLTDLTGRSTAAHKSKVDPGDEDSIQFVEEFLLQIHALELMEMERLCEYMRKKAKVDVGEGITRPASLLNTFQKVLEHRREQLLAEGVELKECCLPTPKKKVTRKYNRKPKLDETLDQSTEEKNEPVEDVALMEAFSDLPVLTKEIYSMDEHEDKQDSLDDNVPLQSMEEEVQHVRKDELREETMNSESPNDQDMEVDKIIEKEEQEDADYEEHEKPKKKGRKKKEEGEKKKEPAERKHKTEKRKKSSSSFADALAGTSKPKFKKSKKDEKPLIVDGMPVAPLADLQEKRNDLYNYNPLEDACALGHTPIQSAYRRSTKLNLLTPKFNTNKYKIEGARDHILDEIQEEHEGHEEHILHENPTHSHVTEPMDHSESVHLPEPPRPPAKLSAFNRPPPPRSGSFTMNGNGNGQRNQPTTPQASSIIQNRRASFTTSTAQMTPQHSVLPNYLPQQKPLISPIPTPMAQRVERRHMSMDNNTPTEENDCIEEMLRSQRNMMAILDMVTKEMMSIDAV